MKLKEIKTTQYMSNDGHLHNTLKAARCKNFNLFMDKHFPHRNTTLQRSFMITYYATLIEALELLEQKPEQQ